MASQPKRFLTAQEYLTLERQAEYKSEYMDGEVFAMSGVRENHALLVINLTRELSNMLRRGPCRVYGSDMRVCVSPTGRYTYPDLSITCEKPQFLDDTLDTLLNPTLLIEVLSPTTKDYDRGGKFVAYRTIASFREYFTIDPDRIFIEQWVRQDDGRWILSEHTAVSRPLRFESLGVEVRIADLYEGVTLDEPNGTI
ncbi:MAG: Uma2 family endonuclease [Bryobacteraceae bacterium]